MVILTTQLHFLLTVMVPVTLSFVLKVGSSSLLEERLVKLYLQCFLSLLAVINLGAGKWGLGEQLLPWHTAKATLVVRRLKMFAYKIIFCRLSSYFFHHQHLYCAPGYRMKKSNKKIENIFCVRKYLVIFLTKD